MLTLDPTVIGFLAIIAGILVQAVKGVLSADVRRFLPIIIMAVMSLVGLGLAAYVERDLVVGVIEGFFAGASSVGLYEGASRLPGLNSLFNSQGWFKK